ncbi:MAG: endolytic transglycosylase MltG [Actinobacteria bacterium]|nr:endolytic transglycosylase MltG [Actinomycetota bacterium]
MTVRRRRGIAGAVLLVAVVVLIWFLVSLFQPFAGSGHGAVSVRIPRGVGVGGVGDILERRGVVSSSFFFQLRVTLAGSRGDLKSGTYDLRRDMSYGSAIDALVRGPVQTTVTVTIPEGLSRREVARLISRDGLRGNYLRATKRSTLLDPRSYGAKAPSGLEGFLFPATYVVRRGAPVDQLVNLQLRAFQQAFRRVSLRAANHVNLTGYDVLTIASLIEREAQLPRERRLIASVIYNRLHAHMPLGIDASVRFATGNWTQPLTDSELRDPSPYNTRLHDGLPPGPIGNPGLAAIRAAAHPAHTGYLYYVVKPGTCGEHAFSTDAAQFERDVRQYQSARAANSGRSPTSCRAR